MSSSSNQTLSLLNVLQPEDQLEKELLSLPSFQEGLMWGKPRFGHPEGKVIFHIAEVYENINKLTIDAETRKTLRLVALVHDTFKKEEEKFAHPRSWEQNHAVLARKFLANYTDDRSILDLVEFHDSAYFAWRNIFLYNQKEKGLQRIDQLKARFKDNFQTYYLFFKCDTRTGDKNQTPLKWFEQEFDNIELVKF